VLHVTGVANSGGDVDNGGGDAYAVLVCGSVRHVLRSLPSRRDAGGGSGFLLSARDLALSAARCTPASDGNGEAASPVLAVELWAVKRWGADVLMSAGELPLAPAALPALRPGGPPAVVRVVLQRTSSNKAGGKAAPAGQPSAPAGPGLDSGWVLGAESQVATLRLVALPPPPPPPLLLGTRPPPGGGGGHHTRGDATPMHSISTDAAAASLGAGWTALHTSGGHLYNAPSVQLLRVVILTAEGLHALHVDPAAAAAAAAGRRSTTVAHAAGSSSARDRAGLAAASAALGAP
jgi:hypothetical protein